MTTPQQKQPIHLSGSVHDPSWNPHNLVSRRLREACNIHASRLSERTTISSSVSSANAPPPTEIYNQVIHPLARASLPRSSCPQPPLDDAITGGGSSVACNVHFSGMNVKLDPLERAAPHRIVVPENEIEDGLVEPRGEMDGTNYGVLWNEQRSATWNAISALATMCDEVEELDKTFESQILPSIVLFSADDYEAPSTYTITPALKKASKKDIFDEDAKAKRESALLARIGKFVPALQLASNGTVRLRRLVKNMVVQLGGCSTPAAVPFYFDRSAAGDENGAGTTSNVLNGEGGNKIDSAADDKGNEDQLGVRGSAAQNKNSFLGEQPPIFGKGVSLIHLGKAIGTALRILIAVDTAIATNTDLQEAWAMYKDVVMEWSEEKRIENIESLERMMVQIEFNILSSRSFIAAIEQNFDPRGRFQSAKFHLHDEIISILLTLYGQYCERINTEYETSERLDCVGVYGLYVLYRHLLPPNLVPDAKLHKSLWSVFPAMCPILELYGPLHFIPREFMMIHAPYEAVKGCSATIHDIRAESASLVLKWDGSFAARVAKIRLDSLGWLASADSELSSTVNSSLSDDDFNLPASIASIERATSCILRGLKIAYSASILLRGQLVSHRSLELNVHFSHMSSILALVEVLKSIEKMLRVRRRAAVLSFQRSTLKMISSNILKRFDRVRSYVDQTSASIELLKSPEKARSVARISACLSALEGVLKGTSSFSPIRRYSAAFSVAACTDPMLFEAFAPDDLRAVEGHIKDLNQISSIEDVLSLVCDCSFLYFYRDLIPNFIELLQHGNVASSTSRLQLLVSALSDPERILKCVKHLDKDVLSGSTLCFYGYEKFVLLVLKEEYVAPICDMIETDLRLAIHAKNAENSKNSSISCVDKRLRSIINAPPIHFCQKQISLKKEVELHLEKIFYNLCTLNLNDCKTYSEMRVLAEERYGLHILDPCLPDGSLELDLDFIDILRDLSSFVSRFNYNMIEQSFVERMPKYGEKYLRTLNVKCTSAALKQHGLGVVASSVNVSYKILAKKFQQFTQFLAADYVKSLLAKEVRWYMHQKNDGNSIYPFERAASLAKEINKQGQTSSGITVLDQCRIFLTEMGNIIAFVRIMRASKRKVLTDQMPFLPSSVDPMLGKIDFFEESGSHAKFEMEVCVTAILNKPDPDYIRAFVNVFKGVVSKSDNSFMNGFFCMVPALCLCWMESSLQGKEMMHKKNITKGGYYVDDGFAVGLSFCLSVLGQVKQYESLNWFKSIQSKYAADEDDLVEKKNAEEVKRNAKISAAKQSSWFVSGTNEKEQDEDYDELTMLKMMRKRLEGNRREMAMLFFSLHGAQSFFKDIRSSS
mmetsp:Transcript_26731/g.55214  ORF Transcript_26731/g.55214 Transcript_26731/m.55214 type:complete len:1342 (+) Transcript_26731:142-4167(+)